MKNLITVVLIAAGVAFLIASCDLLYAQSPLQSYVKLLPPSGWQPPAIIIQPSTPDSVRLCLEREQGLTACRSVEEFKIWVTQSSRKYDLR